MRPLHCSACRAYAAAKTSGFAFRPARRLRFVDFVNKTGTGKPPKADKSEMVRRWYRKALGLSTLPFLVQRPGCQGLNAADAAFTNHGAEFIERNPARRHAEFIVIRMRFSLFDFFCEEYVVGIIRETVEDVHRADFRQLA